MSVGPYPALVQPLSPWECPRCGSVLELGSKRSLWSLLPLVCDHRAADYARYFRELAEKAPDHDVEKQIREAGFEEREVYKRPVQGYEKGLRQRLRSRLRDELQGRRRYWWLPMHSEERDRRQQFRNEGDEYLARQRYEPFFAESLRQLDSMVWVDGELVPRS